MRLAALDELLGGLDGVRRSEREGHAEWRFRGRLVARQLDARSLVIRCDFATRERFVRSDPTTFGVPRRYERHMMVVADLRDGDPGAIEDALVAAWELRRRGS